MCRMLIYKGAGLRQSILLEDLLVRPKHSIIRQSYNCQERFHNTGLPPSLNADGFGIGWYSEKLYQTLSESEEGGLPRLLEEEEAEDGPSPPKKLRLSKDRERKNLQGPCIFNSISPAWNNSNLLHLSAKISSPLFFAHVRAASIGSVTSEVNCHPFCYGKYMFMHNGGVAHFNLLKRRVLAQITDEAFGAIHGSTDSEHCFALFLSELQRRQGIHDHEYSPEELKDVLESVLETLNRFSRELDISETSLLNFAVTDGKTVLCTRYANKKGSAAPSLYIASGTAWVASASNPDHYYMRRTDRREQVVVLASERLANDEQDWVEVPRNHTLVVTAAMNVLLYPINTLL